MLKIGELAKRCNVSIDTLRFYEKNGLIAAAERTEAGYRLYNHESVQRMQFILSAKQAGLTLQEISDLLTIRVEPDSHCCQQVKGMIDHKLAQVEQKIGELEQLRDSLRQLSDGCSGGAKSARYCTIMEALENTIHSNHKTTP